MRDCVDCASQSPPVAGVQAMGHTQTTSTANGYGYGNSAYGTAHSTTIGGQTYNYAKPRTSNTIVLLKDKDGASGLVYDAQFLVKSLRVKYNIQSEE